jgi:hypothetical protein
MLKFICDTCNYETDSYHRSTNNGEVIPVNWITLSKVTIHNEVVYNKAISYGGNLDIHFCSKKCFQNYFFNPETATARTCP